MGEAISLSDKIIVLTKRPSTIKTVHNIDFDKNLSPTLKRRTMEFNSYYDNIWKDIDKNV